MDRQSRFPGLILAIVVLLLCVALGLGGGLLYLVPKQAEQTYGPPATRLGTMQRIQYSLQLVLKANELNQPRDPSGKDQSFEIRLGESVPSIAARLVENGLISDPDILRIYLVYTGMDTSLQAGKYKLSAAMSPIEIAKAMQDATPEEVQFGVLPGWRLEEIAAALPTSGLSITPEDFLTAARNVKLAPGITTNFPEGASLEGFLLPGIYTFRRDISAGEMVLAMVQQFDIQVTPQMRADYSQRGLNLYQAVTLASIIQREAIQEDEQPAIASVFFNRLSRGMKLDSDPTVQYALGYNQDQKTWWTNPLSSQDLQVDSPYNTYANPGLPPGPIDNPGISTLKAVANPETTPYLYFRARCDGSKRHVFSKTYDEHVQNACP